MDRADGSAVGSHTATSQRALAGAIIAAGCIVSLALNLPGHLSYDSVLQLAQGRAGVYNWHPPVMAWMLGIADSIVPGASLFVVFDSALLFATIFSLLFLPGSRASWRTVLVAAVFAASPLLLLYAGIVWKDVLFAATAAAGFVALTHAAARWSDVRTRSALLVTALPFFTIAALARQNGITVVPFAAIAVGLVAASASGRPRVRDCLTFGLVWLAAVAALVVAGHFALKTRTETGAARGLFRHLQVYDLAGAVSAQTSFSLDFIRDASPTLERRIRNEAAPLYGPVGVTVIMEHHPDLLATASRATASAIGAQWRDLIFGHPLLYLKERALVFAWLLFTPDTDECKAVYAGVHGPEAQMTYLGLAPRMDRRDELLARYARSLTRTPIYSHVAYLLLAVVLAVKLARRGRPPDVAIAAMLASALAFTATFFVVSIACDYRYVYFLDVAAMVALMYVAVGGTATARRRFAP